MSNTNGAIGLYDERNNECFDILQEKESCKNKAVSQVKFSHDGVYLYSRIRGNASFGIRCWDIRQTGKILNEFKDPHHPTCLLNNSNQFQSTNQRLYFDCKGGKLAAGFQSGSIGVWDTATSNLIWSNQSTDDDADADAARGNDVVMDADIDDEFTRLDENTSIASVALHPHQSNVLCTSSNPSSLVRFLSI